MTFKNKKILITGAGGGIGKVLVRKFKDQGAIIAATDLDISGIDADFNSNYIR